MADTKTSTTFPKLFLSFVPCPHYMFIAPLHSAITAFYKTTPPLESGGFIITPKFER